MKLNIIIPAAIGLLLLLIFPGLSRQRSMAPPSVSQYYDTSKVVTLSGKVVSRIFRENVPALLLFDVTEADGNVQRWVLQGDTPQTLQTKGWDISPTGTFVKGSDGPVSAAVYLPKTGSTIGELLATIPSIVETAPDRIRFGTAAIKARRPAHGIELTLTDGKKLEFGTRR
jgi:hypothetical protein